MCDDIKTLYGVSTFEIEELHDIFLNLEITPHGMNETQFKKQILPSKSLFTYFDTKKDKIIGKYIQCVYFSKTMGFSCFVFGV